MNKFFSKLLPALILTSVSRLWAAAPEGYYAKAEGQSGQALRAALHEIIQAHHVIPYSGGATDVTAALKVLDQDPNDTNNVVLIYSQRPDPKTKFNAADGWNREHLWCNSYGLDSVEPAYSDLFNLRPEDVNVNSARGNKYYDTSDVGDRNYSNPATPEALLATTDTDSWEPPEAVKGSRKTADLEIAIADASRGSGLAVSPTRKAKARAGGIMYIECKAGGLTGMSRIWRVAFSKTGRTLYYDGRTFQSLKGAGFKSNYYCVETGEDYWISGPKRRGDDALYGGNTPIEIDEDVREEYWRDIRQQPERVHETVA